MNGLICENCKNWSDQNTPTLRCNFFGQKVGCCSVLNSTLLTPKPPYFKTEGDITSVSFQIIKNDKEIPLIYTPAYFGCNCFKDK